MDDLLHHVRFVGIGDDDLPIFDIDLCYPDRVEGDLPATKREMAHIIDRYGDVFPPLTTDQADALLSAGSWGHYYTRQIIFRNRTAIKNRMATAIAAMILSADEVTSSVVEWSRANFEKSREPDVQSMPYFDAVHAAVLALRGSNGDLAALVRVEG